MSVLDWPERIGGGLWQLVREQFRVLVVVGAFGWLAVEAGFVDAPQLGFGVPLWARVVLVFGGLAAVGGHWVGSKLLAQIDPDWQWIIEVNNNDPATPRITKVTPAVIQDMEVFGGRRLHSPDGLPNHYICRYFNRDVERPVAHVTWKDVPSDWELLGTKPSVIEEEVAAMRDTYEETHGMYQWVLDHLYMVVRRLDFRRTESQNAVLEDHVTPSMDDDRISDVVDDIMPDQLKPDRLQGGDPDDGSARADESDEESVEDQTEDIAPDTVTPPADGAQPAATDGGTDE